MTPWRVLLTMASSEDSTMAARRAAVTSGLSYIGSGPDMGSGLPRGNDQFQPEASLPARLSDVEDRRQIPAGLDQVLDTSDVMHARDDVADPVGGRARLVDQLALVRALDEALGQHLQAPDHRRQRVVDLVGGGVRQVREVPQRGGLTLGPLGPGAVDREPREPIGGLHERVLPKAGL